MNQNFAMDDREATEGNILFSSSSLLSDTKGGGKISGHKWGKLGRAPGRSTPYDEKEAPGKGTHVSPEKHCK
jgi:hypothetical protein